MIEWIFSHDSWERPEFLFLSFAVVFPFIMQFIYRIKRKRELVQIAGNDQANKILKEKTNRYRRFFQSLLIFFLVITIAGPRGNPHPHSMSVEGRDLVFILDISRSMLAEDVRPCRLERARIAIKECVEKLSSSRIALVVYAGSAEVRCPLTWDHNFFMRTLEKVYPNDVKVGGTRLVDALVKTCEKVFVDSESSFRDVILITDGEDHGSLEKVANLIDENKVNLMVFGIGDSVSGARIPLEKDKRQYQMHEGEIVWTKLEETLLRQLVDKSDNASYVSVQTRDFDLHDLYKSAVGHLGSGFAGSNTVIVYDSYTHISAGISLFILLLAYAGSMLGFVFRKGFKSPNSYIIALSVLFFVSCDANDRSELEFQVSDSIAEAIALGEKENWEEATSLLERTIQLANNREDKSEVLFQLGIAYFELGKVYQNREISDEMLMEIEDELFDASYYLEQAAHSFLKIASEPRFSSVATYNFEMVNRYIQYINYSEEQNEEEKRSDQSEVNQAETSEAKEQEQQEEMEDSAESESQEQAAKSAQENMSQSYRDDGSGLPIPSDSPEDIMKQMEELQEGRQSDKSPRRDTKVKKDW